MNSKSIVCPGAIDRYLSFGETIAEWKSIECIIGAAITWMPGTRSSLRLVMDKFWTRFLNQDTAFFTGADKIARFLDAPVIYVAMRRVRKGHYSVRLHVLVEPPYEGREVLDVVERYARQLEGEIRASPPDWLWVHNKWKYPKPAVEAEPRKRRRARRAA